MGSAYFSHLLISFENVIESVKKSERKFRMPRAQEDRPLFPGGRRKAFTVSSDDGVTQDRRLTELMRKYGIRGTFHLNSGLMGRRDRLIQSGTEVAHDKLKKEEIAEVYDGFEIAAHTMTHPDLTKIPFSMAVYEISENKKELEDLVRHPVEGMSYPYGRYNDRVKKAAADCGIVYARTTACSDTLAIPQDFLAWQPTCHYCEEKRFAIGERFLTEDSSADEQSPMLFYVWGHAYQLDAYNDWETLEEFFRMMGGHEEIWYASGIEICSYMRAVSSLIYSSAGDYIRNPSCMDVWMQMDHQTRQIRSGETIKTGCRQSNEVLGKNQKK